MDLISGVEKLDFLHFVLERERVCANRGEGQREREEKGERKTERERERERKS